MKKILFIGLVISVLMAVLLAGCLPQSSPPKPFYYYTLDYTLPPDLQLGSTLPVVLRVERFSVSPPFNSQRIIYADKGLHRNAYAHYQWIAAPGELLPFLMARDLGSTKAFHGVLTPDNSLVPTHILSGWIEEFLEKDQVSARQASLRLNITLINALESDPGRRILLQQSYNAQARCEDKKPASLAEAMSTAMAQVSAAVIQDVYRVLAQHQ